MYTPVKIVRPDKITPFFSKKLIMNNTPFRIIHIGDSHIQGDRITGHIRKAMHQETHNGGNGLFFPYSLCASFGPSGMVSKVVGKYSWSTLLKNPLSHPIGLTGYEITLSKGANLTMEMNTDFKGKMSPVVDIWIHAETDTFHIESKGAMTFLDRQKVGSNLYKYRYSSNVEISRIAFQALTECSFFGSEYIQNEGLIYQQSGLVGAQFTHFAKQKNLIFLELKELNPHLIIFSFGSNESYSNIDSLQYFNTIRDFIKELHLQMPECGIIISSGPDTRSAGKTPKNELMINRQLSAISKEMETGYFDLNQAMGGWESVYKWNQNKLFSTDLLHFNQQGSQLIAELFTYALSDLGQLNPQNIEQLKINIESKMSGILSQTTNSESLQLVPVKNDKPPTKKKPVSKPKKKCYVVKNGDTLSQIAKRTGRSVSELAKINHLKSTNKISVGQKIYY